MSKTNSDHWTGYWDQGMMTSLPTDFKANYDSEVKQFWYEHFEKLPDNAQILDVCTGNGAIALLAAEYSTENNKSFVVTATDAAQVNMETLLKRFPEKQALVQKVHFKDQVALEEFNADKDSFDFISSQYGIEYCDWPKFNNTLAGWLKQGGTIVFMSHAIDTRMLALSKSDYDLLDSVNYSKRIKELVDKNAEQKELQDYIMMLGQVLSRSKLSQVSPTIKPLFDACKFVMSANAEEFAKMKEQLFTHFNSILWGRARFMDLLEVHNKLSKDPKWFEIFAVDGVKLIDERRVSFQGKPAGDGYTFQKSI
jgi:ubiquinone/menaquinone biosynthesis C-methylase UbiE